jgi:hypothetical protein
MTSSLRKVLVLIGAVVATVLLVGQLFPAELKLVEPWTLQVVDDSGRPLPDVTVVQAWGNTALQPQERTEAGRTGPDGNVAFPARFARVGLATRIAGTALAAVESVGICRNPLGSFVFIRISDTREFAGAGFGGWYRAGQRPRQVVLHRRSG